MSSSLALPRAAAYNRRYQVCSCSREDALQPSSSVFNSHEHVAKQHIGERSNRASRRREGQRRIRAPGWGRRESLAPDAVHAACCHAVGFTTEGGLDDSTRRSKPPDDCRLRRALHGIMEDTSIVPTSTRSLNTYAPAESYDPRTTSTRTEASPTAWLYLCESLSATR